MRDEYDQLMNFNENLNDMRCSHERRWINLYDDYPKPPKSTSSTVSEGYRINWKTKSKLCFRTRRGNGKLLSALGRWLVCAMCVFGSIHTFGQSLPVDDSLPTNVLPSGPHGRIQQERTKLFANYYQPVKIWGPNSVRLAAVRDGTFGTPQQSMLHAGLLIGHIYRFQVSNIPGHEGQEVYPTIKLVNRLHPPPNEKLRFPIPIELTQEELEIALAGQLVTRVIYLESSDTALPHSENSEHQRYFEIAPGNDPLPIADQLGRPMAVLRLGGILPDDTTGLTDEFLFGSPPLIMYEVFRDLTGPSNQFESNP